MKLKFLAALLLIFGALVIPVKAETVIATTNITFADTIVAKVVSEVYNIPQVIVGRDSISNDTLSLLQELNATNIIIIGGPAVVSYNVENELKSLGYNVTRIWGVTRFETSALVAKFFWSNASEAVILTGELTNEGNNFEKIALVRQAEDLAIEKGIPILIVPPGEGISDLANKYVLDALIILGVKKVYIFSTLGNLSRLTDALSMLNISYEIVTSYQPENCTPIKIAVPVNASWEEIPQIFIYKKCVEIIPVEPNVTLEELMNMNVSIVLLNSTDIAEFKMDVINEMKEKVGKERRGIIKLISRNIFNDLDEIEENKQCYNETIELLKNNETEEAFKELLECLKTENENRWKNGIYINDSTIENVTEGIGEIVNGYGRILRDLINFTGDVEIENGTFNPEEIRDRIKVIREAIRDIRDYILLNGTINISVCIPMFICAIDPSTGKEYMFLWSCDVPSGWKIVPCNLPIPTLSNHSHGPIPLVIPPITNNT